VNYSGNIMCYMRTIIEMGSHETALSASIQKFVVNNYRKRSESDQHTNDRKTFTKSPETQQLESPTFSVVIIV